MCELTERRLVRRARISYNYDAGEPVATSWFPVEGEGVVAVIVNMEDVPRRRARLDRIVVEVAE